MDRRVGFMAGLLSGEATMTQLCESEGISRKTGYKWKGRYESEGVAGLADRSHAPKRHGRATDEALVDAIVQLREARPTWGPRKIIAKLEQRYPALDWPSPSTAGEILKRAGLVSPRRFRRGVSRYPLGLTLAERPGHVWAADHKGWVRLGDGCRCEPLTVTDSFSRYLIALEAAGGTHEAPAKRVFRQAFETYGLPQVIRSDNGPPFASTSVTALTRLTVWWTKLGVRHERIAPGKPQQNGRHERFHRTLLEAMTPPAPNLAEQARRFEAFRRDYNEERPHEALSQVPPADLFCPSPRPMPARLPEPQYADDLAVRKVRSNGQIKWRGELVQICAALDGEAVALEEDAEGGWRVWFYATPIGRISRGANRLMPMPTPTPAVDRGPAAHSPTTTTEVRLSSECHPSIRSEV